MLIPKQKMQAWRRSWDTSLTKARDIRAAKIDMLLIDHGFTRALNPNRHLIGRKGTLWAERSAHPLPHQVKACARRGIKTIVNLRGSHTLGATLLSAQAAKQAGIDLRYLKLRSRDAPHVTEILAAKEVFDSISYPALFHCKSGADRAGLAAALFVLLKLDGDIDQALEQLSLRYGHFKQAKTGLLDKFLLAYRDFNQQTPIAFLDWVQNHYDPEAIRAQYQPRPWARFIVDVALQRE